MNLKVEKISIRQAMVILLVLTYSPCMRLVPTYTAEKAGQVGWLSPILTFFSMILLVLVINSIYKKYQEVEISFSDIICDILGKIPGKLLIFFYILFLILLTAFYARYFAERLVGTLYVGEDNRFFVIVMLISLSFLLGKGLVVIARMSEIIFIILLIVFLLLSFSLVPNIDINNLTPISYIDIFPIANASIGVTEIWAYYTLVFFFSDRIANLKSLKKAGFQVALFALVSMIVLIITCTGTLGSNVVKLSTFPYIQIINLISVFDVIERIESIVNLIWTASDFILVGIFSYITIHLLRFLFNIKNISHFKNIFLVLIYILSSAFASNENRMLDFSLAFFTPTIMFFCYAVPVMLLVIGKIRKKI